MSLERASVSLTTVSRTLSVLLAAPGLVHAQQPATPAPLVLDGATVVDVEHGALVPAQRVMIVGTRIQAVGGAQTVTLPKDARVVDARGKYLIPGLWDMHVHTDQYPQLFYPLLIAHGVTGAREMWHDSVRTLIEWRQEIARGERVGPRTVVTGPFLGGHNAETPEAAVALIRELKADGSEFIKIRGGLSRETYFTALAEARRLGLPLMGHLSDSVTLREASDSGQRTIEHEVRCPAGAFADAPCAALAAHLHRNGTWLTPTIVAYLYLTGGVAPERLRFWPDDPDVGLPMPSPDRSAEDRQATEDRLVAGLATLVRAGMPLLAGTDASSTIPEDLPGVALHDELALFVQAGMTPAAALQAATLNPALALKATDSLGTVAPGKLADLVVLTADPLVDIAHLDKIDAVIANGRYFDRAQLDALITDVERQGRGRPGTPTP